ncbi:MAG: hypothetical protein JJ992_27950, partial [Planctomycetes bacterium]|nr:hypothetical protein [Planctomycetota bacterium]
DWIVGGTGKDRLFGGTGDDLLNADDNLETNGGANDQAEDAGLAVPDFAFGGAGLDVLIANTGADRLFDWSGVYNTYAMPFASTSPTVVRDPSDDLTQFLLDLARTSGADPSLGEPGGELGLVTQSDSQWGDQQGAARDPANAFADSADTQGGAEDDRALIPTEADSTPGSNGSSVASGQASNADVYGATVWFDADEDGRLDADEPRTISDIEGRFELVIDEPRDLSQGVIRVQGGVDVGTGMPLLTMLTASPTLHKNVTPLTTFAHHLARQGVSEIAVGLLMRAVFDLDPSVDIGNFDHFEEARLENPVARKVLVAVTAIQGLSVNLHHFLSGAAGSNLDDPAIIALLSDAIYGGMAGQLLQGAFEWGSKEDLRGIIARAAAQFERSAADLGFHLSLDKQRIEQVSEGLAEILASDVIKLRQLAEQASDGHELVTVINQIKRVIQRVEAPDLQRVGRGELSITEALARYGQSDSNALAQIRQELLPPHMSRVPDNVVLEDGSVNGQAFRVFDFETPFDQLTVTATSDNPDLLPVENIVISTGADPEERQLSIAPVADRSGVAVVQLTIQDADGFQLTQAFRVTVMPVNDAPTFTLGLAQIVSRNDGPITTPWATGISAGAAREDDLGQYMAFELTVAESDRHLFSVLPSIDPQTGLLQYTPNPSATGVATVNATLRDGGGTDQGGQNTARATFEIITTATTERIGVLIIDVTPDPRPGAVDQISIVFAEPVIGFDVGDLT